VDHSILVDVSYGIRDILRNVMNLDMTWPLTSEDCVEVAIGTCHYNRVLVPAEIFDMRVPV
jgi:hypothetical protein